MIQRYIPTIVFSRQAAYSLIEIMMVLAVISLVLGFGLPAIIRWDKGQSFQSVISDLVDLCNTARTRAILRCEPVDLVFEPGRRLALIESDQDVKPSQVKLTGLPTMRTSVYFPDDIYFEMLDVNFVEYKDAEQCRVRFYPNGTCEELTVVLRSSDGRFAKLALEPTTSIPKVEYLR